MQQIIITLTSPEGVVSHQTVTKPYGKPALLSVPEGIKIDVQVQAPIEKNITKLKTQDLKLKQVGKSLVIEGEGEALLEVSDFYSTPDTSIGGVSWNYTEPVFSAATQSIEGKAVAEGGVNSAGEGLFGTSMPIAVGLGSLSVAVLSAGGGGGHLPCHLLWSVVLSWQVQRSQAITLLSSSTKPMAQLSW